MQTNERDVRRAFAGTLVLFGGFVGVITRVAGFLLKSYQMFTQDKSLIKKLYAWKDNTSRYTSPQADEFDAYLDDN
jgi:hypothetical protein